MSARKAPRGVESSSPPTTVSHPRPRPRKKAKTPRVRLTHLEVRRGAALRVRISIADDVLAEAGTELGALINKIAPSTQAADEPETSNIVIPQEHSDEDAHYHANVREHLAALFGSLCDTSLTDALEIAREESTRRAAGRN